ncbi:protease inhibitor I42 family protein [uncultured Acinetobacter sp.]|uniref:protease inhibitor I42 family protein n=1 Tax=uncultured Acinetobacter sp. TaxID=165433 RepID=UPI00260DA2B7|nr:protease inhibitor I42 family protein [uncultured Acinetobacter sp.]
MKKIALALLGTTLLTACVSTPKPTELPKGTYNYTVDTPCADHLNLKVGESISVQFYDNSGSTGYSWSVVGAKNFDVTSAYVAMLPTDMPVPGAGQDKTFTFTAKAAGTDQIAIHHGRGWEGQAPARWSCKVTVN